MTGRRYQAGDPVVVAHEPRPWARRRPRPVVQPDLIAKIGRTWITLASGKRFDPETGEVDGGDYDSEETVWPSAEAYARDAQRRAHWDVIRRHARGDRPPETLDDDALAKIAAALKAEHAETDR